MYSDDFEDNECFTCHGQDNGAVTEHTKETDYLQVIPDQGIVLGVLFMVLKIHRM